MNKRKIPFACIHNNKNDKNAHFSSLWMLWEFKDRRGRSKLKIVFLLQIVCFTSKMNVCFSFGAIFFLSNSQDPRYVNASLAVRQYIISYGIFKVQTTFILTRMRILLHPAYRSHFRSMAYMRAAFEFYTSYKVMNKLNLMSWNADVLYFVLSSSVFIPNSDLFFVHMARTLLIK